MMCVLQCRCNAVETLCSSEIVDDGYPDMYAIQVAPLANPCPPDATCSQPPCPPHRLPTPRDVAFRRAGGLSQHQTPLHSISNWRHSGQPPAASPYFVRLHHNPPRQKIATLTALAGDQHTRRRRRVRMVDREIDFPSRSPALRQSIDQRVLAPAQLVRGRLPPRMTQLAPLPHKHIVQCKARIVLDCIPADLPAFLPNRSATSQ